MGKYRFPPSFIQELLSQVDIVEIVSHYLSLKQVGRNFTALCPFHPEKTPSFVVSPEKQIFKCFGCGVGGNAITFVEKYENLSFWEAVKRVAELGGIEIPSEFKEEGSFSEVEEEGLKVATFFHSKLSTVADYLKERGISTKTAERFLLGYAPSGYLKELKVDREVLKKLGVVSKNGKEFFSDRLVIPIFNHGGKVVAFAGRILKDDKNSPKYINSPESEIFKKNSVLYGFYQSKETILKEKSALIVEGYFDVISLHQAGFRNAVAPMGTSITENHVRILSRYVERPILAFDGDKAGKKATLRAAGLFLLKGKEPFVLSFPEGEDPDSLARSSLNSLKDIISSPMPFIDWVMKEAFSLSELERGEFLKEFAANIASLKEVNPFLYKVYVSKISAQFDIDPSWFKKVSFRIPKKEEENSIELIPPVEKAFLKGIMEKAFDLSALSLSPNVFYSQTTAKLYTLLKSCDFSVISLQSRFPELAPIVSEILFSEFSEEEIKSAFRRLWCKEINRRLKRISSLEEKMFLKRLSIELEKGNLEVLKELDKTLI